MGAKKTKETKTRPSMTRRSLMMKDGKIIPKSSLIGTKRQVFRGTHEKTKGGLTKKDLMQNKNGRVVSKKAHAIGTKKNGIAKWAKCFVKARKQLGISGFCAVKKGTKLYKLTRKFYDA